MTPSRSLNTALLCVLSRLILITKGHTVIATMLSGVFFEDFNEDLDK